MLVRLCSMTGRPGIASPVALPRVLGKQATGRVDIPGEAHNGLYKQKVAAAS